MADSIGFYEYVGKYVNQRCLVTLTVDVSSLRLKLGKLMFMVLFHNPSFFLINPIKEYGEHQMIKSTVQNGIRSTQMKQGIGMSWFDDYSERNGARIVEILTLPRRP